MSAVRVTDRTWEAIKDGVVLQAWPDTPVPAAGAKVTVFDSELDFTRHEVLSVDGSRVVLGPAIPWEGAA